MSKTVLSDFRWLTPSGFGSLPEGLLALPLEDIAKRGDGISTLPLEDVCAASCAVLLQVSPDKKIWTVDFYNAEDPRPLLSARKPGQFRISFYQREGRFNVTKIHAR